MLRKTILLSLVMLFVLLMMGTCWAEKPIGEITSTQQVIDKLFTGRTLDPIEGIWLKDAGDTRAIVKSSLLSLKPNHKKCDYVSIVLNGKYAGNIGNLFLKTEYSFVFHEIAFTDSDWKLLSPTVLQYDGRYSSFPAESYVRIYPTSQP